MSTPTGFQVLDPTSEPIIEPGDLAPRLDSLTGKRIGLYANFKLNAVELLDECQELLSSRFELEGFVRGRYDASRVMRPEEWEGVEDCDAVILTHGD